MRNFGAHWHSRSLTSAAGAQRSATLSICGDERGRLVAAAAQVLFIGIAAADDAGFEEAVATVADSRDHGVGLPDPDHGLIGQAGRRRGVAAIIRRYAMPSDCKRLCAITLTAAAALSPANSDAVAPALLFMVKQIAQQAATSMIKDAVLSSLSGMGCKGIALSNAISAFDLRKGGAGAALGGMPSLPAGMSMPNMPMTGFPGLPAGASGLGGLGGLGAIGHANAMPPDIMAKMQALMSSGGPQPAGAVLDPEEAAMMARMQQSMAQPLSPLETVATIDELFELGFLPKPIQAELKQCMVLVPASVPALGMGMGMMKPMIPQLRQARSELHALSPQEQDEVAAALVQEVRPLPADQRAAFLDHVESGFFPPHVAREVKRGLSAP